jgi:hypothetical protein
VQIIEAKYTKELNSLKFRNMNDIYVDYDIIDKTTKVSRGSILYGTLLQK